VSEDAQADLLMRRFAQFCEQENRKEEAKAVAECLKEHKDFFRRIKRFDNQMQEKGVVIPCAFGDIFIYGELFMDTPKDELELSQLTSQVVAARTSPMFALFQDTSIDIEYGADDLHDLLSYLRKMKVIGREKNKADEAAKTLVDLNKYLDKLPGIGCMVTYNVLRTRLGSY